MADRLLTCNSCPNWQMILFVHCMLQYIARLIERLLTAVSLYALTHDTSRTGTAQSIRPFKV